MAGCFGHNFREVVPIMAAGWRAVVLRILRTAAGFPGSPQTLAALAATGKDTLALGGNGGLAGATLAANP